HGTRVYPGLDELAQHGLRAGRRLAPGAGRQCPPDERVGRHVLDDLLEAATAIARRILQLLADLGQRAALPGHRERRQVPVGMSRHADRVEVRTRVAGRAVQSGGAVSIRTAAHGRLVEMLVGALQGTIASGMAVHAARTLQDVACRPEGGLGALPLVADPRERARWLEGARHLRGGERREETGDTGGDQQVPAHASRLPNGSRRTRLPVSWNMAFATAGAI